MDNLNQLGKVLKDTEGESGSNIRRVRENIAAVHRTVDKVNPTQPFTFDFHSEHTPDHARMDIMFTEVEGPCVIEQIDDFAEYSARCPAFGPADGSFYPGIDAIIDINVGGFIPNATGGVNVPFAGIYEVIFTNLLASVSTSPDTAYDIELRHNGGVFAVRRYVSGCGLCAFFVDVELYSVIECAAGDNITAWVAASPTAALYLPSDFCGLFGAGHLQLSLAAQS